jgi:hypothetical protein
MSFTSTAATVVTKGTVTLRELPMPTWTYGAIALACFFALLGVLWCFRNTAAKYDEPAEQGQGDVRVSRGSRGASDHGANH